MREFRHIPDRAEIEKVKDWQRKAAAHRAAFWYDKKSWKRALHEYGRVLSFDPQDGLAAERVAECFARLGEADYARQVLEKATQIYDRQGMLLKSADLRRRLEAQP